MTTTRRDFLKQLGAVGALALLPIHLPHVKRIVVRGSGSDDTLRVNRALARARRLSVPLVISGCFIRQRAMLDLRGVRRVVLEHSYIEGGGIYIGDHATIVHNLVRYDPGLAA